MKRVCIIIPARYNSSRFQGKPLFPLLGKPMILWVSELCSKVLEKEHIFIATDDVRIKETVSSHGYNVIMTSKNALTGTDRVAEAALKLDYDIFINVQGDEPLINPNDILNCIEYKVKYPNYIINAFTRLIEDEDPNSKNIPKVVVNENNKLIYMSRGAVPAPKEIDLIKPVEYFKQVCIYGFSKSDLISYFNFGRKSRIESIEDIEILRFLDLDIQIKMFKVDPGSIAVDCIEDVEKVENKLKKQ
jgi:3-deoxy-manno-octulosonate cytidylyltransferase (CMP-KDO synthetase)